MFHHLITVSGRLFVNDVVNQAQAFQSLDKLQRKFFPQNGGLIDSLEAARALMAALGNPPALVNGTMLELPLPRRNAACAAGEANLSNAVISVPLGKRP